MKAKDVMTVDVVSVSPDHSVRHAARMLDDRISGLPVIVDAGRVVGIITDGDLMHRSEIGAQAQAPIDRQFNTEENPSGAYVKSHSWKMADVMTSDPVKVDDETPLPQIAALMAEWGIKRLPSMRGEYLVGKISQRPCLRVCFFLGPWPRPNRRHRSRTLATPPIRRPLRPHLRRRVAHLWALHLLVPPTWG